MKITSVRVLTIHEGNLVAYADITIDHSFVIRDLQDLPHAERAFRYDASGKTNKWQISGNCFCD